ncbi:MAG: hypothetical protein EA344_01690 [Alkalicoccus sp.]|nr:MAG: hypothetical protein EA344_01690 [Alkalicoccus sp.]
MALLKLRVVIGVPAAPFSSLAAEKAFSSPSLTSGRIFPLSFSAGVSKNHLGTGFTAGVIRNHKKQKDVAYTEKRSGNRRTPVEEGDWKIPQSVSSRKLEISSTASLPS